MSPRSMSVMSASTRGRGRWLSSNRNPSGKSSTKWTPYDPRTRAMNNTSGWCHTDRGQDASGVSGPTAQKLT